MNKEININLITEKLKNDGGFFIQDFFSEEDLNKLDAEFAIPKKQTFNNNNSGLVYYNSQKFISQTLVHSKFIFNFLTSQNVFGLFKNYLGKCVLKASRYYFTGGGGLSMWHHDEKNNGYSSVGLIMIIYLTDVVSDSDGPFEYIKNSHKFSDKLNDNEFFVKNISEKYSNNIVTVFGKAGTILFADSRVIHRAKPHKNKAYRKSLFVQVSRLESHTYKERLLVNPSFIIEKIRNNPDILNFLGFGLPSANNIFPPTDIYSTPLNRETLGMVASWVFQSVKKKTFEIIPLKLKKYIRKKIGRIVDYDSISK